MRSALCLMFAIIIDLSVLLTAVTAQEEGLFASPTVPHRPEGAALLQNAEHKETGWPSRALLRRDAAVEQQQEDDAAAGLLQQGATHETSHASAEERINRLESTVRNQLESIESLRKELHSALAMARSPALQPDSVRIPETMAADGSSRELSLAERVRYLERKVAGASNWFTDPQLWRKKQYRCENLTDLGTGGEHHLCLDGWEERMQKRRGTSLAQGVATSPPCIVYDLGIRAQPAFGKTLMTQYGCAIRAYDPSPTTAKWWASDDSAELRRAGKDHYNLHQLAAGGQDGPLELFQYNWQQVSIVKEERDLTRKIEKPTQTQEQQSFDVQAHTFPTMLQENGDTYADVMKIDIEGSEYMFLQDIFDRMGCPPVGQITIEYHHFSLDERYGSSPEINTIHHLLNSCGFRSFMVRQHWRNAVTPDDSFYIAPKRYTLASYCKEC